MISANTPLLFMHIPKTGGMSLFTAFTVYWGEDIADLYDVSAVHEPQALALLGDDTKTLFCGHFSFGLHRWLSRPSYYVSVLREPVSRMVSLYHYCQPMFKTYGKRLAQAGGSMAELARQPKVSDFYLDFERCLRGDRTPSAFFASPSAELDNGMVRRFSGFGLNPAACPESALAQAKENIERYFSVVGLLERYEETLGMVSRMFGLPDLNKNHVNRNKAREEEAPLDAPIIEQIRRMNRLDIELYDWVAARFDRYQIEHRNPILVPGEGCREGPVTSLWRAVGQSPVRQAAMKERGVPKIRKPPPPMVICNGAHSVLMSEKAIMLDMELRPFSGDKPGDKVGINRMVLQPKTAKKLIEQLTKAISSYEAKFGISGK